MLGGRGDGGGSGGGGASMGRRAPQKNTISPGPSERLRRPRWWWGCCGLGNFPTKDIPLLISNEIDANENAVNRLLAAVAFAFFVHLAKEILANLVSGLRPARARIFSRSSADRFDLRDP